MRKRTLLIIAVVAALAGLSVWLLTRGSGLPENLTTEVWRFSDNTVNTWFVEGQPDEEREFNMDNTTLHFGKTAGGKDIVSLLRLPLKATWLADEVYEARLFLKLAEGEAPASVSVSLAMKSWNNFEMGTDELRALIDGRNTKTGNVKAEADGWISIPVTEYVKIWMNGDMQNNGLAIFGADDKGEFVVVSGYVENEDDYPYFEVSGAVGQRESSRGNFGYTEMPTPGMAEDDAGNCLSYALRDNDMILIDDLGVNVDEMNRIYMALGEDGIADYIAGRVESYMDTHKEGLSISNFRRLDDFNSEIDGKTEYRIALRVGVDAIDGVADFHDDGAFDYHFRVQTSDGRWAQKYPLDVSEIIPYGGADVSPVKYDWDAALQWLPKFQNFYSSKVIYFAVTKDVNEFTRHKSAV
ncbi:MAG: DNRLRE domain-containing protein [Oscillospiraceae bacterium]|jgi:hypothetical protein|nr:DNRLRE domain-containing protein [Oscillospiraceae bacterium]